jgi:hypothetical protein
LGWLLGSCFCRVCWVLFLFLRRRFCLICSSCCIL